MLDIVDFIQVKEILFHRRGPISRRSSYGLLDIPRAGATIGDIDIITREQVVKKQLSQNK